MRNVGDSAEQTAQNLAGAVGDQPAAEPLSAGEVVTTGTLTSALTVGAGETWAAEVTAIELPRLTLALTK